ncbi:MAG: hypothetical protein K0V04_17425 [Deltaproteobacteria bacterium]|nr:hypothetical protein [Deltaproteobacteria bacterium]
MVALYAPLSLALTAIAHMAPSAEAVIHEPPEGARLDYAAPPPPKASDETIEPDTPSSDAEADDEAEAPGDGEAREAFELQPPSPEGRRGPSPGIPGRKRRTPQWGTRWFNVAVHASSNSVGVGLGALLFPTPYLGLGLDVDEIVIFDVATVNLFQITPRPWCWCCPTAA